MQVNRIQSNNYNASFGRVSCNRSSSNNFASGVKEVIGSYCGNGGRDSSAKDLVEKLIDKCDDSELKEIAKKISKKLKK